MFESNIEQLEKLIGYTFKNKKLLDEARTTPAYGNEHQRGKDNAVLAKLGDAVLKPILVTKLIENGVNTVERISVIQHHIESRKQLAIIAENMGLKKYIKFGWGEKDPKQTDHKNAMAETLEAIIAAVFLDSSYDVCRDVVLEWDGIEKFFD